MEQESPNEPQMAENKSRTVSLASEGVDGVDGGGIKHHISHLGTEEVGMGGSVETVVEYACDYCDETFQRTYDSLSSFSVMVSDVDRHLEGEHPEELVGGGAPTGDGGETQDILMRSDNLREDSLPVHDDGRITVPKPAREHFDVGSGDVVIVTLILGDHSGARETFTRTIDSRNKVTIPARIRDEHGIEDGQRVDAEVSLP